MATENALPLYLVDAFSTVLGGGNPAAVVLSDGRSLSDDMRQRIAAEMNQSETAFVETLGADTEGGPFDMASHFKLRWFTPTTEVPMCGHATLASAAVLFQEKANPNNTLHFHTMSGVLSVSRALESKEGSRALQLHMALPIAYTGDSLPPPLNAGLDSPAAKQLIAACVGDLQVAEVDFSNTNNLAYVVLRLADGTTQQQLEAIKPNLQAMPALATAKDIHAVIVTCQGDGATYDFLSRFFAPWMGIPEDPVTGSAHAVLGPFWCKRLGGKGSSAGAAAGPTKSSAGPMVPLRARQCSARGGDLQVLVYDSVGHVQVSGAALVVLRGMIDCECA